MRTPPAQPVVHLELRTRNLSRATAFYTRLFDWSVDAVEVGRSPYLILALAHGIEGGVVELADAEAAWLPYVEVPDVRAATARGERLGGAVMLEPREGPAGWRSILEVPDGAHVGLWQPKV
jgi:predicted enzyme related to lactoylglutathione lyase